MYFDDLTPTLKRLAERLSLRGETLATAESCTGGLIAAACTELAGSSSWFEGGFVTYSNTAKQQCLGVPAQLIQSHGAVSSEVVEQMLKGALSRSQADWSVAVSGVAGPGGGSEEKPVGTVWAGWANNTGFLQTKKFLFTGNRQTIRKLTLDITLKILIEYIE